MKKFIVAPLLAALVMFLWGFVYYGVSAFPYQALQATNGDVGPQLNALFPASGTYVIPDPRGDKAEAEKLVQRGPIATVHIHREGAKSMDPLMLARGFGLEFVSCLLLAVLLTLGSVTGFGSRLIFAVIAGMLITLYSHGGEAIWWQQDWAWHGRTMIYDVVAWFGAGLVLALLVKPSR